MALERVRFFYQRLRFPLSSLKRGAGLPSPYLLQRDVANMKLLGGGRIRLQRAARSYLAPAWLAPRSCRSLIPARDASKLGSANRLCCPLIAEQSRFDWADERTANVVTFVRA